MQREMCDVKPDREKSERRTALLFSLQKSRRRRRFHPFVLFLLFLVSGGLAGVLMWLMR